MKASSLSEIKKEFAYLEAETLRALCLRLARYKKENKELLTYLLFESHNEQAYVAGVKTEMDELFASLPKGNVYFIKKGLRKILRLVNRQIKYSEAKETELALRIYFCASIKEAKIHLIQSQVLANLYQQQLRKIDSVLARLPEDLQFDYHQEMEQLK